MQIVNRSKNPVLAEKLEGALFYCHKLIRYVIITPVSEEEFLNARRNHKGDLVQLPWEYLKKKCKYNKKPQDYIVRYIHGVDEQSAFYLVSEYKQPVNA